MKNIYDDLRDKLQEKFEHWDQDIRDDDVMDLSEDLRDVIQRYESFKLFRYMPATYYNIRNFEKQRIHLSQNGLMNDVYEGVPGTQGNLSYLEMQKLKDLASMTCLTETKDNTLMWSHYADSHRGFCVEYDLKWLREAPFEILKHILPVVYTQNRMDRDLRSLIESHWDLNAAIEGHYEYDGREELDDILPMFLTKGMDWEYEKEWRIVYTRKQMYDIDDERLYEGNLSFPCVSAVYLGYRCDKEIRENMIEIADRIGKAEKREICVYQAMLEEAGFRIEFERIF